MNKEMKELEAWLHRYVNNTEVIDDQEVYFIKRLVEKIRNMKIEIYSNDHNPPHFHVKSDCKSIDAVFGLYDGSFIEGQISGKDKRRIEAFYQNGKDLLIKVWNETRIS